jgi:hypothetical protein
MNREQLRKRIRHLLLFFIAALVLSGLTAFPLVWEIKLIYRFIGPDTAVGELWPALSAWIAQVHQGLLETDSKYPFLLYGTDWLAYAHLVIAIVFWGPLRDPVRNIWVVEFGMIACLLLIPVVVIFGPLRGIPPFWQILDCSFGVFGFFPLWLVRRDTLRLAVIESKSNI